MKIPFIVFGILVTLLGCQVPTTSTTTGSVVRGVGTITHLSESALKGVYLKGASVSAKSLQGRSIVTSSGATLGGILPTGVPTTLSFLDKDNALVTATVSQALQLTTTYVLLTYQVDLVQSIAVMNRTTGAVANLDTWPDSWGGIYALGTSAWYEAAGTIVKADLDTGATNVMSTQSAVYQAGDNINGNTAAGRTGAWDASAWIYVDNAGNAFVVDLTSSADIRAVMIASGGTVYDIGASFGAGRLGSSACGNAMNSGFVVDPATNVGYWAEGGVEKVIDTTHGTTVQTGWTFNLYAITFAANGISFDESGTPLVSTHLATLAELPDTTFLGRLGYGSTSTAAMWTDATKSVTLDFVAGVPTPHVYDTSTVPAVLNVVNGARYNGVLNFRYNGGKLYYGPTGASTIGVVTLGASSTTAVLATGNGPVQGWAVVGDVLFWTDSVGNWQAPIVGNTLGTVVPYSGGQVVGVTG